MKPLSRIVFVAVAGLLAACGQAGAPSKPVKSPIGAVEIAGPVSWNAATGAFDRDGKPLRTFKLWTFDGSTDGFTGVKSKVSPADDQGLAVTIFDPSLRSPKGLDVPGAQYPMVIVRLTRTATGEAWDGALYYSTPNHPESISFLGKPMNAAKPGLNETVTLVYDMSRPAVGAGDWQASAIDQIRLDIEDKPGGQFVIHQVAIAENPNAAPPPKAASVVETPVVATAAAKP